MAKKRRKSLWRGWTPMSEEDVEGIVVDLFHGSGQWMYVHPSTAIEQCMPLALGELADYSKNSINNIGGVIGDANTMASRSVNGKPIFMACKVIHTKDWERILVKWKILDEAATKALEASRG